jgi:uncharacterized protein YjiS (DUF1127 family)
MCISKIITSICNLFLGLLNHWSAYVRKQRSIRAMARLDDHLLDDIGFRREGDELVPLTRSQNGDLVRNHKRKVRLRSAFLIRRRERVRR